MPEVRCAYDELVPLIKLVPNPRNPNKHPESQIRLLAKIIEAQGWRAPITVSTRSGFIVRGHGRYEAAKAVKADAAPVDFQDYATEAEEWADLIADNRIAEFAETDEGLLAELLKEIDSLDFDLELTGFTVSDLEDFLSDTEETEGLSDPDAIPDTPAVPVSAPGDLWILGNHRLLCGDATKPEDVARLMDGGKAHMIFTDPPYNVDYEGKAGRIQNDKLSDGDFARFISASFKNMYRWLTDGGAIYVCYSDSEAINFRQAMKDAGFKLSTCLIWRKNQFVLGRSDYHLQHEPILYGWKPTASHRWFGGRKRSTIHEFFDGENLSKTGENEYQLRLGDSFLLLTGENLHVEELLGSVLSEEKPLKNDLHPTMKPVSLIMRLLKNSSRKGEIVQDLFGGSGSTLIACEKTARVARLLELDPRFCDVILRRWEDFTGRDAVLQESNQTFTAVANVRLSAPVNAN